MLALKYDIQDIETKQFSVSPEGRDLVNHLRGVAMKCRVKPQAELFRACALLQTSRSTTCEAHSEALMRCLPEAFGAPAQLAAPGTRELTFDEHWLVQLATACARGDDFSRAFLLRSRIAPENRRLVNYLIAKISEYFPLD